MSYILEALRRAEIEREGRRRVPGLHAQPVLAGDEPQRPRSKAWLWVVLGLAAGLLLALLWRGGGDEASGDAAPAARAAGSVAAHESQPVGPAPAASAATEVAPTTAPAAEAPPAQAAVPAERPPAHRKPATKASKSESKPRPKVHEPPGATAATPAATPERALQTPPAPSAPAPRLRTLAELPADVRARVPQLSFGGSVYSEVPAQRLVILNGQVLREGDAIVDGVWLEQIRPHSAVIRVGEQRFEYPF